MKKITLKITVFSFEIFWWKSYNKISRWYVRKLFRQIFLFRLYFRKFLNILITHKICLQTFKPLFQIILRIFDLGESLTVKPLLKLPLSSLATFSWNLENWKASSWTTKNSVVIKLIVFSLLKSLPILWGKMLFKILFRIFYDVTRLNSNKHGFLKQPFIIFLQNRYSQKLRKIHMKALEICNSNKKRLQCRCFPKNFSKFLRITFLQNTSRQLLLDFFIHLKNELIFAIQ